MVFITHCLKSAWPSVLARWLLGAWLCLLLAAPALAAPTQITQLRVEGADDGVHLSAVVRFELPAAVEEALLKGVAIFFVIEADIYRDRWYWTDPHVSSAVRTLRLAYQPLTGHWRVNIVPGLIASSSGLRATLNQNYDTLAEALSAVQRTARWKIAEAGDLDPSAAYTLDLNFKLDLSQLPRPFQIGIAGQRDWTIAAQFKDRLKLLSMPSASVPVPVPVPVPTVPATPATTASEAAR